MQLPEISLPTIELPFPIEVMLHPLVVHFAITLPFVAILLELINLILERRVIGVLSFFLLLLASLAFVAAYFTGIVDGKEAYDLLSDEAKVLLKEHKTLGIYLLIGSLGALLFKLLSVLIRHKTFKAIYMLLLFAIAFGLYEQGKHGGELVYTYGANVKAVKEIDDMLFEANEKIDELQESLNEKEGGNKSSASNNTQAPTTTEAEQGSQPTQPQSDAQEPSDAPNNSAHTEQTPAPQDKSININTKQNNATQNTSHEAETLQTSQTEANATAQTN